MEEPNALDLLEEVLSLVDIDCLNQKDHDRYREICALTADLRDGTDV